jgi:nitrite reductase/ring-hydroxylating ferredoxin subunit
MRRVAVAAKDGWQDNEIRRVEIMGRAPIALYRVDGQFYATDDTCTHGEASLADGFLDDFSVVCPFHSGSFDVRTGRPTSPPCYEPLASYRVIVDNDVVFVELPELP